jgi:hypothetical protein
LLLLEDASCAADHNSGTTRRCRTGGMESRPRNTQPGKREPANRSDSEGDSYADEYRTPRICGKPPDRHRPG